MSEINSYSETDASNNSATPNGWPEGQSPSSVNDCARAMMGALARDYNRRNAVRTTAGTTPHFTYATSNTSFPASYINGMLFTFRSDKASAGSDDFAVNSLGAKPLYAASSSGVVALAAGQIQSGQIVTAAFDSSLGGSGGFQVIGIVPAGLAGGTGDFTAVTISGHHASKNTFSPSDPTGTTNSSEVMMGLGSTCSFTPRTSGVTVIMLSGVLTLDKTGHYAITLRYGTGSAPSNNGTAAGTKLGTSQSGISQLNSNALPFCLHGVAALTAGTTYWIDMGMAQTDATAANLAANGITVTAFELSV